MEKGVEITILKKGDANKEIRELLLNNSHISSPSFTFWKQASNYYASNYKMKANNEGAQSCIKHMKSYHRSSGSKMGSAVAVFQLETFVPFPQGKPKPVSPVIELMGAQVAPCQAAQHKVDLHKPNSPLPQIPAGVPASLLVALRPQSASPVPALPPLMVS